MLMVAEPITHAHKLLLVVKVGFGSVPIEILSASKLVKLWENFLLKMVSSWNEVENETNFIFVYKQ